MKQANIHYWRIAPGSGGSLWVEQRNHDCVAVGWSSVGDLNRFKNKERFEKEFHRQFAEDYKGGKTQRGANILWQFYKEVKKGDKMLINSGQQIFGIGTIVGGYKFNDKLCYTHSKRIRLELHFWEPANARELGLPKEVLGKICGLKSTITKLEPDDWKAISEKLHRVKNPFKGISDFEGLARSPVSEQEVIVLFSRISPLLEMKIEAVGTRFPDALIRVKKGGQWVTRKCEFEKRSSDFVAHGHNAKDCDMIICWKDDLKRKPNHIKVIELRKELQRII